MENTSSIKVLSTRLCELIESETYAESTMTAIRCVLNRLSSFMERHNIVAYTPEVGSDFVTHCSGRHLCPSLMSRTKNVMGKLNRLLQGKDGKEALMSDNSKKFDLHDGLMKPLLDYLAFSAENGNRQNTIHMKYLVCGNFLKNLSDLGCLEICNATLEHVQAAFSVMGYTRYWERVGPFLRFLFENNYLEKNYSGLVQPRRRPMPMPAVYTAEEIARIESSLDLSIPSGIRNYAILLLMTRYGIRACDVAALTFDDIDFDNARLRFMQQKTGDPWEGEMIPEVKAALLNYIGNVRPNLIKCSSVFITMTPPYAPIDHNAVNTMVWTQFENAELGCDGRKRGSRAFRSSVASNMINDGISTEIVRKVLGHGTRHALKHYARMDMESMRLCPLPVPDPSGAFAEILSGKGVFAHV